MDVEQPSRHKRGLLASLVIAGLRRHQSWTRYSLPRCVFVPSCSEYAIQAVAKYGTSRGLALTVRRLLRCHPGNGGYDPP
ncbi:MAG: membrane protein insertion efficiency factor YidD [Firmicutes bacterium]|nr:membrane protein insertion efficiency factor YidD [Bacillota bacterium]